MHIIDTLGFEAHVRNMREKRGEKVPIEWYRSPHWYELTDFPREKIKKSGDAVRFPWDTTEADYEFEIAVRFDESFKTSDEKEAVEFVRTKMHFAIFNDFSCRDRQKEDRAVGISVSRSKSMSDKSFGKWIPASELTFDSNGIPFVLMKLLVNGQLRTRTYFHTIYFEYPPDAYQKLKCVWGFPQVIAYFGSIGRGFKKGTVLGSGTVGQGSIAEMRPLHDWLRDGDKVILETDVLGSLENEVKIMTKD